MSNLREAVENWVRAEHAYRLGPDAYSNRTQAWLLQAEEQLRKACTGKKYLYNAAKRLGVRVEQQKPRTRVRLKDTGKTRPSPGFRRKGGLFGS